MDENDDLNKLMSRAEKFDGLYNKSNNSNNNNNNNNGKYHNNSNHRHTNNRSQSSSSTASNNNKRADDPMDVDSIVLANIQKQPFKHLSQKQRDFLARNRGCFKCREINVDHNSKNCPTNFNAVNNISNEASSNNKQVNNASTQSDRKGKAKEAPSSNKKNEE